MPKYHLDEVARLEDIEALLITARDLVLRFDEEELAQTCGSVQTALGDIRAAKVRLIEIWREADRR